MDNKQMYSFSFYRDSHGGEIGPQLETQQRFCVNKKDAIKTGKLLATQANWRLVQIKSDNNIIFEK